MFTCACEDHCRWDVCRLVNPPTDCLNEVDAYWKWDFTKNYWVAQKKVEGIFTCKAKGCFKQLCCCIHISGKMQ